MMGHNMHFKGEIFKIIPKLSLLPLLIWGIKTSLLCLGAGCHTARENSNDFGQSKDEHAA